MRGALATGAETNAGNPESLQKLLQILYNAALWFWVTCAFNPLVASSSLARPTKKFLENQINSPPSEVGFLLFWPPATELWGVRWSLRGLAGKGQRGPSWNRAIAIGREAEIWVGIAVALRSVLVATIVPGRLRQRFSDQSKVFKVIAITIRQQSAICHDC